MDKKIGELKAEMRDLVQQLVLSKIELAKSSTDLDIVQLEMHKVEENMYKGKGKQKKENKPSGLSAYLQLNKLRRGDTTKPTPVVEETKTASMWNPFKAVQNLFTKPKVEIGQHEPRMTLVQTQESKKLSQSVLVESPDFELVDENQFDATIEKREDRQSTSVQHTIETFTSTDINTRARP